MRSKPPGKTKPKLLRGAKKPTASAKINQATTDDMQREGLGIAAKE